jgi:hypothetical protein
MHKIIAISNGEYIFNSKWTGWGKFLKFGLFLVRDPLTYNCMYYFIYFLSSACAAAWNITQAYIT